MESQQRQPFAGFSKSNRQVHAGAHPQIEIPVANLDRNRFGTLCCHVANGETLETV